MQKCSACSMENEDTAKFCVKCGSNLSNSPASSESASANPVVEVTTQAPAQTQGQQQASAQTTNNAQTQSYQQPSYGTGTQAQTYPWTTQDAKPQYEISETDKTLRLIAFAIGVATCVGWGLAGLITFGILLIPLAWSIPLTVCCWGIYKGTRPNTAVIGVCTLIFLDFISGILLLISKTDEQ